VKIEGNSWEDVGTLGNVWKLVGIGGTQGNDESTVEHERKMHFYEFLQVPTSSHKFPYVPIRSYTFPRSHKFPRSHTFLYVPMSSHKFQ
jgi:hypothetical protein